MMGKALGPGRVDANFSKRGSLLHFPIKYFIINENAITCIKELDKSGHGDGDDASCEFATMATIFTCVKIDAGTRAI